ncbi:hypothetical protein ACFQZS_13590 [Mucilaginibacter calamicampi]|uniref:Adhesin domain-containing protein n=1 Tax=Mucilaginibacter calamicampi TaxID=1302352 RepID=A0ABW2YXG6_9SPHI
MRSKIFKALSLCLLSTLPAVVFAQAINKNVMAKYVTIISNGSGADTDTGSNTVYIFTTPEVADVKESDPDNPVVYLYNNERSVDDNNIELIKNYTKSYTVRPNDKLEIDNLYGKISVNTWNRNEIKVEVQVKVAAKNDADARILLNKVSINNKKTGSKVSFKTNIAKEGVWNLISGNNKNIYRRIEINYNIYMPTRNALDISNQWGIIELPDFEGKVVINCSYTNLIAQSLSNTAEIHINNGDAKIAKLKMSDLNISYGNLSLGSADKLTAVVNFSSAKIGKINTSGVISMQYGTGLQIDDLDKNMKNLSVNSSFSNVNLGVSDTKNANFNVTVRNGSFSFNNPAINMATKSPADSTAKSGQWQAAQSYRGHVGKGSTTKIIKINSSYGSVKFN